MLSSYSPDEDTQDVGRTQDEHDDVRQIIRQRQKPGAPLAYSILAGLSGGAALLLWGYIFADSAHEPGAPIDREYGAFLAFSAVVGVSAAMSGIIWLRERDASRNRADADRIREHQHTRQVKAIRDAIGVFLRDGDEDARKLMAQTQQFINGTEGGTVHRFRGRG